MFKKPQTNLPKWRPYDENAYYLVIKQDSMYLNTIL